MGIDRTSTLQTLKDHPLTKLGEHICGTLNGRLKRASAEEMAIALMVNIGGLYNTTTSIVTDKEKIESVFFDESFWTQERLEIANGCLNGTEKAGNISLEEIITIEEIYVLIDDFDKAVDTVVHMRNQRKIREQAGGVQTQVVQILEKKAGTTLKIPLTGTKWNGIGPIISPHATGVVRIIRGPDGTLWDITLVVPINQEEEHMSFRIEKE